MSTFERTVFGLLLAKIETTYGTDPVPLASTNLIAVSKSSIKFDAKFDHLTRSILDGTLGKTAGSNVLPEVSLSFDVEIRGNRTTGAVADISAGAIANVIEIDPLLQACDLTPTYTAEGSSGTRDGNVIYAPTVPVDQGKSVTFYIYTGQKLYIVTGAKGTFKGTMQAGQFGMLSFTFSGLYNDVVDSIISTSASGVATVAIAAAGSGYAVNDILTAAGGTVISGGAAATFKVTSVTSAGGITGIRRLNVGSYSASPTSPNSPTGGGGSSASLTLTFWSQTAATWLNTKPPIFVNSGSTVASFSPVFQKIDFDYGAKVTKRFDANSGNGVAGFMITDRAPSVTIDPESVAEATHPIYGDLSTATARAIVAKIGSDTGNKFQATFEGVSKTVGQGDRSGIRTSEIAYDVERATIDAAESTAFQLKFY